MKRRFSFMLITVIAISLMSALSVYAAGITVKVNGQPVSFPDAQPYIDENNRTLVPVRFVSEALGARVEWQSQTNTVSIKKNNDNITLRIGEKRAYLNGQEKTFDTSAILRADRTFVPLRFVSETLGANVDWVASSSTVVINTSGGGTYSANGYAIPVNHSLTIDTSDPTDVPTIAEIYIAIELDKPLQSQYVEAKEILASKFGENVSEEVLSYAKQKTERWKALADKDFRANGQTITVGQAGKGSMGVSIRVWKQGIV